MAEVNRRRAQLGRPPHPIDPDAYEPQEVA
jgi:hypothetical protein